MSHLPIPLNVVYAGLAGTVLSLLVATATNKWSPRVFFLLALRLAIGWHFAFEGLHKIHSYYTGPTDTNRPFTSEPYFKVAPGPLGEKMRKEFSDPSKEIATKVRKPENIAPADFAKLSHENQAAKCPEGLAKDFDALEKNAIDAIKAEAEKELKDADERESKATKDADEAEQRALKGQMTQDEITQLQMKSDDDQRKARATADGRREQIRERRLTYERIGAEFLGGLKADADGATLAAHLEIVLKALKAATDDELKIVTATEKKAVADIAAAEQRALKGELTEKEKATLHSVAEAVRKKAKETADKSREEARKKAAAAEERGKQRVQDAKAEYARWVYGVDPRACKVKGVTGDVLLSAPQRLDHLDWVREQAKAAEDRETDGLGNGNGTDIKRVAEFRTDALNAETDLARDANAFIAELKKELNGGKAVEEPVEESRGKLIDRVTMWFLVAVGACLMGGLLTRLACVLAAGFLVMTYLAHPAFPWYPLPPMTEGNPVFINKNVIEALALLTLACYPTGRWLGLDALVLRPFCKYKGESPVA